MQMRSSLVKRRKKQTLGFDLGDTADDHVCQLVQASILILQNRSDTVALGQNFGSLWIKSLWFGFFSALLSICPISLF